MIKVHQWPNLCHSNTDQHAESLCMLSVVYLQHDLSPTYPTSLVQLPRGIPRLHCTAAPSQKLTHLLSNSLAIISAGIAQIVAGGAVGCRVEPSGSPGELIHKPVRGVQALHPAHNLFSPSNPLYHGCKTRFSHQHQLLITTVTLRFLLMLCDNVALFGCSYTQHSQPSRLEAWQ